MPICATSVVIDAALGLSGLQMFESYLFRFAAVASIIAIWRHLSRKRRPLIPVLLILTSLTLSTAILYLGAASLMVPVNIVLKAVAIPLMVKPEVLEVEIVVEKELNREEVSEASNQT